LSRLLPPLIRHFKGNRRITFAVAGDTRRAPGRRPVYSKSFPLLFLVPMLVLGCAGVNETVNVKPRRMITEGRDYTIGPDDVLQIVVWKNESLSRTVRVRPDGKITLPLINDIQATGLSPQALRELIATRLERFVEVAGVTVMVQEVNSAKVSVLGQVKKPGVYPIRGDLSVLDAIALAEGFNEFAATDRMVIIRREGKQMRWLDVRYRDLIKGSDAKQPFFLEPGDTLVIP